jgi:hypothetical protein
MARWEHRIWSVPKAGSVMITRASSQRSGVTSVGVIEMLCPCRSLLARFFFCESHAHNDRRSSQSYAEGGHQIGGYLDVVRRRCKHQLWCMHVEAGILWYI